MCSFLPFGCKIITLLLRDNRNFLSLVFFFLGSIEKSFRFCQSQPVAIDNLVLKAHHDCRRWKMEWDGIRGSDVCWGGRTTVNPFGAHCSAREVRRENEMNSITQSLRVFSTLLSSPLFTTLLWLMFVFLKEMLHDVTSWCRLSYPQMVKVCTWQFLWQKRHNISVMFDLESQVSLIQSCQTVGWLPGGGASRWSGCRTTS